MKNKFKFLFVLILSVSSGSGGLQANIGILNGLTHEHIVHHGQIVEGVIVLKNSSDQPEEARLYLQDFSFNYEGKKEYTEPGTISRSNTSWIQFSPSLVTVPPQETMDVKYTIQVPETEEMTGTYWSILMVEGVPQLTAQASAENRKDIQFGIKQLLRYGIQLVTHIEDSGTRNIKFLNTELVQTENGQQLNIDVENTGERWLRPNLVVELYDEMGSQAGKVDGGKWRIYPGTSVRFTADLTAIASGKYIALVIVDNHDDHVFGAQFNLDLTAFVKK